MTKARKIGLWTAGIVAGLVIIMIAASFLVPLFIDQQSIRARLQEAFAAGTNGTVDYERLEFSFFPPRGKLTNIEMSIPGRDAAGVAESATAYLELLPLFRGRVQIGSIEVRRPDFRVGVSETQPGPEEKGAEELSIENLAGGLYGALSRLQAMQPDLQLLVEKGRLRLTRGGEPMVTIRDIEAQIELPPDELSLDISSASDVWEDLRIAAKVDRRLEGKGRLEVKELQPQRIADLLSPQPGLGIGDSRVNAAVRFEMKGLTSIEGDVEASAPKLTLRRGQSTAPLKIDTLKGRYRITGEEMLFTLSELAMGSPRMKLSGRVHAARPGPSPSVEIVGREMDVNAIRELSLSLARDLPMVKKAFETVLGGTIEQAVIRSRGNSWADLAEPANMDIAATVSGMRVHVPEADLNLEGVTGNLSLSESIFKGEGLSARSGKSQASNGSFALGLQEENPPLHLDMNIRADLAEAASILTGIIEDKEFQEEMKRVKQVEGTAEGRVVLGERLDSIRATVEIAQLNLRGEHERLPYPVEITNGRLKYEGDRISWQALDGRMGRTSVSQTSGMLHWGEPPRIEVLSGQAVLNLDELYPWANRLGQIPATGEIGSLKGQIALSALQLQGPLNNPREWAFQAKGQVEDLLVESPRLPSVLNVGSAGFSGNPERLQVEQAKVSLADAALILSGGAEGYTKNEPRLNLDFQGTVGPVSKEWISDLLGLPPEIRLRAPLSISRANLVWGKGKETALKGTFTVAGGPQVSLDLVQGPEEGHTRIRNLVIDGPDGRAVMAIELGEKVVDLKFQGDLSEATMRQIAGERPYLNGWIRGDFSARILKDKLEQSRITGTIRAGDLSYQGAMSSPVLVNRVSLNATGEKIEVHTAEIAWRGTEVAVKGSVGIDPGGLLVDLTVSSEGFTWEKVTRIAEEGKKGEGTQKKSGPGGIVGAVPVHGVIHVNAAYFQYGDLRWEPFVFDLKLKGKRVEVAVTEGRLCGIPTEATVRISPEPMELEAETEAKGSQLQETLSCFFDTRLASGQFDFTGDIAASGASEDLLRNLQGQFTITAGEGRIYRFGILAKILSVVNITEIFKGRGPDLAGKGIGYKSAKFVGKIEDGKLQLQEGYIEATSMGLAFEGGIDLPTRQIDVTALVTPLKTVDTILENIPILGGLLGDNFMAVPVRVKGDISDPSVTPLSASAVGSGLLGILERTLKLPGRLIQPLIPGKK